MIQKIIYTVFIGILVAIFVGVGLQAFYAEPQYPQSPTGLVPLTPNGVPGQTAEQVQQQKDYDTQIKSYNADLKTYNRNASIFLLTAAILILAMSLVLQTTLLLVADGLSLGGVLILLYSLGRSFASNDAKVEFGIVTVGLIVAVALGFIKFVRPEKQAHH